MSLPLTSLPFFTRLSPLCCCLSLLLSSTTITTMPKFTDKWVVDKTLFEFVNGGSCACCGRGFFLPDGVEGLINAVSDLETDAAQNEIKAQSPWPPEMKEQVWSDRVRLRHKMKQEMKEYQEFFENQGDDFSAWLSNSMPPKTLKKMMQVGRAELLERLNVHYGIHSAFGTVLSAVTEQVAKFKDTKYEVDARGDDTESAFEQVLYYDRRGGFMLRGLVNKETGELDEKVLQIWLNRMKSLGGPKLLGRAPKKVALEATEDGDDGGADDAAVEDKNAPEPSFRMDRRIIRLVVARFWADSLIAKYKTATLVEVVVEKEEGTTATATEDATTINEVQGSS